MDARRTKVLASRHVDELSKNPRIDVENVRKTVFLHEFDRYLTLSAMRILLNVIRELQARTWGYPTEGAYYRDASSCDTLNAIRIPFFALNALDDPVMMIDLRCFRN